mmetsp:Transcript_16344/g.35531  ORF Transcript_16344/g.35531 Transcript_16344/m.35531 type:complete len:88 (-) Transcript_16344:978-1241(-)
MSQSSKLPASSIVSTTNDNAWVGLWWSLDKNLWNSMNYLSFLTCMPFIQSLVYFVVYTRRNSFGKLSGTGPPNSFSRFTFIRWKQSS